MKNKYGLDSKKLQKIFERDKVCVYCKKEMKSHKASNRSDWYTIEHLNYLPPWNNTETVAICCWACNASRGNKKIRDWFKTKYCLDRKINEKTVAKHVLRYILEIEDKESK